MNPCPRFLPKFKIIWWMTLMLPMMLVADLQANEIQGTVIDVIDGDSIRVKGPGGNRYKIQLKGVVAPVTRDGILTLRELILKKKVRLVWERRDKWRRLVGTIFLEGEDINLKMIRLGHAWFYDLGTYPAEQRQAYAKAEAAARREILGLWSGKKTLAPWRKK